MKFALVLVGLFAYSYALDKEFINQLYEQLKKVGDEKCVPETKASKDDIAALMAHTVPDSHEGKCLIFCFHRHFNMQNEDGSINKDGVMVALEPLKANDPEVHAKVMTIFNTCSTSVATNSDPCLYAGDLASCAIKEGKDMGLEQLLVFE